MAGVCRHRQSVLWEGREASLVQCTPGDNPHQSSNYNYNHEMKALRPPLCPDFLQPWETPSSWPWVWSKKFSNRPSFQHYVKKRGGPKPPGWLLDTLCPKWPNKYWWLNKGKLSMSPRSCFWGLLKTPVSFLTSRNRRPFFKKNIPKWQRALLC